MILIWNLYHNFDLSMNFTIIQLGKISVMGRT